MTDKASGLPLDLSKLTLADLETIKPNIENAKKMLNDWPALNYYRAQNETLQKPDPERIVFLGDSTFQRWSGQYFDSHPSYINRGISGQTTPQILLRLRSDVINLNPKAMFLVTGCNDIGRNTGTITFEETTGNISSIVELAMSHKIKVVLCSILPVSDYHFDGKDPRGSQIVKRPLSKITALNNWLKQYAQEKGLIHLDYFSSFVDSQGMLNKDLSDDDLHPNTIGYKLMETLTEQVIQRL